MLKSGRLEAILNYAGRKGGALSYGGERLNPEECKRVLDMLALMFPDRTPLYYSKMEYSDLTEASGLNSDGVDDDGENGGIS